MNATLVRESARVSRDLSRIMQQGSLVAESPLRIHSRDTDSGGAPEFHPAFTKWLGSVCTCGRPAQCAPGCRAERWDEHTAACEPACPSDNARFRASQHKSGPQRLKKALRVVRRIDPKAHDLLYLLLVLGYPWQNAMTKLNADDLSRGNPERTEAEFAIASIAAGSLLVACF